MSTRSSITVKVGNKFKTVYCHLDGYKSYNGKLLIENYNSQKKAEAIIALGDLSSLDKSLDKPDGHSFDNRVNGYAVAYGRDRGEKNTEAKSFDTYKQTMNNNEQEYNYLFKEGYWRCNGRKLTLQGCK